MDALAEISGTIKTVQEHQRPDLQIYGVIITMFDKRTSAHRLLLEEIEELADKLQIPVLYPPIRRAIAVEEVQLGGSVFDTRSNAAADYQEIVNQLIKKTKPERSPKNNGRTTKKR
jgi:cellulose biosynthesis protein BcsQ